MSGNFKKIIIVVVAILAIVMVIVLAGKSKEEGNLVSTTDPVTPSTEIGDSGANTGEFLTKLLNVRNIELNDRVFSEPAFATLKDSSILLIQDGTEGRPNPFAPIGFENISGSVIQSQTTGTTGTTTPATPPTTKSGATN